MLGLGANLWYLNLFRRCLMEVIGVLIENYETEHIPELEAIA
ncbi:MAG: hypothetical protein V7K97_19625 [Nostoc sp.]